MLWLAFVVVWRIVFGGGISLSILVAPTITLEDVVSSFLLEDGERGEAAVATSVVVSSSGEEEDDKNEQGTDDDDPLSLDGGSGEVMTEAVTVVTSSVAVAVAVVEVSIVLQEEWVLPILSLELPSCLSFYFLSPYL